MALSKIKGTVIADDAINADRIADGTVVASDLLDNTITGAKLATDIAITTSGNITTTGNITGTLATAAQPNITSLGTLIGLTTAGDINFGDNDKAVFGTGGDLEIYHDGSNSYISEVGLGDIIIKSSSALKLQTNAGENYFVGNANAGTELYYNNSKKFETTSSGIDVTGTGTFSGDLTVDTDTLYVDSASNLVGIGTNSPTERLQVVINQTTGAKVHTDTGGPSSKFVYWVIDSSTDNDDSRGILAFKHDGTDAVHFQAPYRTGSGRVEEFAIRTFDDTDIVFLTNNSEAMRIDGSGNVGIGTSSPSQLLEISATSGLASGSGTTNAIRIADIGAGSSWSTTQDFSQLQFSSTDTSNPAGSGVRFSIGVVSHDAANTYSDLTFRNYDGTEHMRINGALGRVGIGTSSPNTTLEVESSSTSIGSNGNLLIKASEANTIDTGGQLTLGNTSFRRASISGRQESSSGTAGYLQFGTRGSSGDITERMRIDSSGNLLVGTSSTGGSSGDTVLAINNAVRVISKSNNSVANNGTLDISINTTGGGYQGFLCVSNTVTSNAVVRTQRTYSVFGRGTDSSIQQIATDNGTGGGATFTVTTPSNGVIRVTNTSGSTCGIYIQFFGGFSF